MARTPGSLKLRILSALVLAPIAIAAVWFGWPWLPIITAVAGTGMAWEWARLCVGNRAVGVALIATVFIAIAVASLGSLAAAALVTASGLAGVLFLARQQRIGTRYWLVFGALWIALPCVLLLRLAGVEGGGRITVLWIFAVVWATDTGAYAFGRWLGGPRLAPRWSPRKTWAGLLGGAICAALTGWGTAAVLGVSPVLPLVVISAGLAIVEQFGDLAESVAKRRFSVKDSSGLIPGHGGLLDRLDGLLVVIPTVALLSFCGGSVLTWR